MYPTPRPVLYVSNIQPRRIGTQSCDLTHSIEFSYSEGFTFIQASRSALQTSTLNISSLHHGLFQVCSQKTFYTPFIPLRQTVNQPSRTRRMCRSGAVRGVASTKHSALRAPHPVASVHLNLDPLHIILLTLWRPDGSCSLTLCKFCGQPSNIATSIKYRNSWPVLRGRMSQAFVGSFCFLQHRGVDKVVTEAKEVNAGQKLRCKCAGCIGLRWCRVEQGVCAFDKAGNLDCTHRTTEDST